VPSCCGIGSKPEIISVLAWATDTPEAIIGQVKFCKADTYSVRSSNSTKILAPIVQAVAVLVVNLRPTRTEVFVHVNLRTINPCSRVERPLSIPICVPVISPYFVKIVSGYQAFENRPVLTLQEDNGCTTAKFESVWTLQGATHVPMNVSKGLTHYMTVSPIAFCRNLRLSPAPAHAQARGVRPDLLVLHRFFPLLQSTLTPRHHRLAGVPLESAVRWFHP